MDEDQKIGERLRQARVDTGLTQREAAKYLHCDHSTLAKKETGDRPVYASELAQFANLYGQSVTYFVEPIDNNTSSLFSD